VTKERIVELRRHLRLDDDIEPNIGAALTECLDEIERLQSLLWTPHEGDIAIWTGDGWEFHRPGEGQTR
jgi:hypothetical protein